MKPHKNQTSRVIPIDPDSSNTTPGVINMPDPGMFKVEDFIEWIGVNMALVLTQIFEFTM